MHKYATVVTYEISPVMWLMYGLQTHTYILRYVYIYNLTYVIKCIYSTYVYIYIIYRFPAPTRIQVRSYCFSIYPNVGRSKQRWKLLMVKSWGSVDGMRENYWQLNQYLTTIERWGGKVEIVDTVFVICWFMLFGGRAATKIHVVGYYEQRREDPFQQYLNRRGME